VRPRRVELREVLSDDLLRAITVDALGADVPGLHEPVRIQHEDGEVLHALDEQTEALFRSAHALFALLALGEIARHLRKSDERAGIVAESRDDDVRPEARPVLAETPALLFETADLLRGLELGGALPLVVGRIEVGEVLADDLVRAVALDALCARVPGLDV